MNSVAEIICRLRSDNIALLMSAGKEFIDMFVRHFRLLSFQLEVSVKWEGLPFGYVWTRNKQLGIVHDPEGILSAALLSSLRLSVFRVYVTDTGPSAFSRFRLRELASTLSVDGDSLTKNGHVCFHVLLLFHVQLLHALNALESIRCEIQSYFLMKASC